MNLGWLYTRRRISSRENKEILVTRFFGRRRISVAGTGQTSYYTNAMWRDAFTRIKKIHAGEIQSVLLLGLGAGGEIKDIYQNFPGAVLTAVEIDPEMIRLTRDLALFHPYPCPRIIEGDARRVVAENAEQFDLIIVDLFIGPEPPAFIFDFRFLGDLKNRLAMHGVMAVNVYQRKEYLTVIAEALNLVSQWTYRYNHLALFKAPHVSPNSD